MGSFPLSPHAERTSSQEVVSSAVGPSNFARFSHQPSNPRPSELVFRVPRGGSCPPRSGSSASRGGSRIISRSVPTNHVNESDAPDEATYDRLVTLGNPIVDAHAKQLICQILVKRGGFMTWVLAEPEECNDNEGSIPMIFRMVRGLVGFFEIQVDGIGLFSLLRCLLLTSLFICRV